MLVNRAAGAFARLLESRARIENPNVPLTGAAIGSILGGGMAASSGVTVNRDTVLGHPSIFRGVSLISDAVTRPPVFVYKKTGDNREPHMDSPAWVLLRHRANEYVRSHVFLKTMVGHALMNRGGYARIIRDSNAAPRRLDILDPELTYPIVENGVLLYQTRIDDRDVVLNHDAVFHVRGLGWDGYDGWSVLDKLKEAIGMGLAAQKFTAVYFKNNAQPRVVIKIPGVLDSETAIERLRNSWGNVHAGIENAHKPAILEGGADIEKFQMSNEDAQLVDLRKLDNRTIATVLGLPSHMLNDDSKTSFASLEQENQRFLDQTIDPWLREIETEANDKLLPVAETRRGRQFVEFTRSAFVRADIEGRFAAYNIGIQSGFMSRAQVRRLENWNVDDEELETYLQPLNMVEAGEQPPESQPPMPPSEPEDESASFWEGIVYKAAEHSVGRMVGRLAADLERAAKSPSTLAAHLESFEGRHGATLADEFSKYCGEACGAQIAESLLTEVVQEVEQVRGQVPDGEVAAALTQVTASMRIERQESLTKKLLQKTRENCHAMGKCA